MKIKLTACAICVMIFGFAENVRADSMDYGALQSLFDEPITTAATGTPQKSSEVAADMVIITADQIRQSGSRNIPSILGMYVPGLNVLQEGIDAFDVGVRGYQQPYQPRLLVMVDGRQVFNDDYSRMAWDNMAVNIDDIRQIEVVKGATSALFGSNATGGVVNIITYSPVHDKDNVASFTAGTQHTYQEDGTATVHVNDGTGLKLSAGGLDQHEFDTARTAGDSSAGRANPSHRYIAESSDAKLTDNFSVNTEATYSENDNQQAVFIYALDPVASVASSVRGGFEWQTPYGLVRNNNYFNHDHTVLDAGQRGTITVDDQLAVSQLEDLFKIGTDHTFRVFAEFRNKQQDDFGNPSPTYEHPEFNSNVYAAGGTWLWQMSDKWAWTNAFRLEHTDTNMGGYLPTGVAYTTNDFYRSYNTIAANSGLVYKVTDLDTVRALYGRGISDPSLVNNSFYDIISPPGVNYEGNPYLKPTVVENYSLNYEHKIPEIFSAVTVSPYYETNHDLAAYVNGGTVNIGGNTYALKTAQNVGNSDGVGTELALKGEHNGFRWDGSYSYQTIRDAGLVEQTLGYGASAPETQLRLNVGYTTGPWEADLHGQYVTTTDMLRLVAGGTPSRVPTDSYFTLGTRIGYKLTDSATVALSGTDITRHLTEVSAYPAVEQQFLLTLTNRF